MNEFCYIVHCTLLQSKVENEIVAQSETMLFSFALHIPIVMTGCLPSLYAVFAIMYAYWGKVLSILYSYKYNLGLHLLVRVPYDAFLVGYFLWHELLQQSSRRQCNWKVYATGEWRFLHLLGKVTLERLVRRVARQNLVKVLIIDIDQYKYYHLKHSTNFIRTVWRLHEK